MNTAKQLSLTHAPLKRFIQQSSIGKMPPKDQLDAIKCVARSRTTIKEMDELDIVKKSTTGMVDEFVKVGLIRQTIQEFITPIILKN